jgi:hypothetical protein
VTELEEFALDALVARGIVLFGHPFDQCGDRRGEGWATEAIRVLLGHQLSRVSGIHRATPSDARQLSATDRYPTVSVEP